MSEPKYKPNMGNQGPVKYHDSNGDPLKVVDTIHENDFTFDQLEKI